MHTVMPGSSTSVLFGPKKGDSASWIPMVRPDPFIVKNCGPYAAEQLDVLIAMLGERGASFVQAQQAAKGV